MAANATLDLFALQQFASTTPADAAAAVAATAAAAASLSAKFRQAVPIVLRT